MFDQVDTMDFIQFASQMWIYSLYTRYKVPTEVGLTKESFFQILADANTEFPEAIRLAVNNYIQPNPAAMAEAVKFSGGGGGVTEKDFFVNYLQLSSQTGKKKQED